ncbi:MAG: hypothetical protein R2762_07665 [Bryobacteraceae bacterium]
MRSRNLTVMLSFALSAAALCARWDQTHPTDELHSAILKRFGEFQTFGMSRIVTPASLGAHFNPTIGAVRDLTPETEQEKRLIESLEGAGYQVVFYLAGRRILDETPETQNYRALKGPAILTAGTPRPMGPFTILVRPTSTNENAAIDWRSIYPVVRAGMRELDAGKAPPPTMLDSWMVSTKPVRAFKQECTRCHPGSSAGDLLGAAVYVYRRR